MKIVNCWAVVAWTVCLVLGSVAAAQTPPKPGKLAPKPLYTDPVYGFPTDPVLCFNAEQKKWFMFYTSRRGGGPGDTPDA